jgi:hypothetical protein
MIECIEPFGAVHSYHEDLPVAFGLRQLFCYLASDLTIMCPLYARV